MDYREYYDLIEELANNPRLIPQPTLYDYDTRRIYAAMMAQLASPLPDGSPSPFTSQSPASGHARMMSVIAHVHSILGHEVDLTGDRNLVLMFRLMGAERREGERPVIEIEFLRDSAATAAGLTTVVPAGTRVVSRRDGSLEAVTSELGIFSPGSDLIRLPARLSAIVDTASIAAGEITLLPVFPSNVVAAYNTGVVLERGREPETLRQMVLRVREGIRAGTLGRDFEINQIHGRLVTPSDAVYWATQLGSLKTNAIDKDHPQLLGGGYPDLLSLCVWPPELSALVEDTLSDWAASGMVAATGRTANGDRIPLTEIIPITGSVAISGSPEIEALSDAELFDLVVLEAIAPREDELGNTIGINPPGGIWGDPDFERTVATAIEAIPGIYAVPKIDLRHAETGVAVKDLQPRPNQLFEIQEGFTVTVFRG